MTFGEQLKHWRADDTQEAAASRLGVPLRTYQGWEQDHRTPRGFSLEWVQDRMKIRGAPTALKNEERRDASRSRVTKKTTHAQKAQPPASGPRPKKSSHEKIKVHRRRGRRAG